MIEARARGLVTERIAGLAAEARLTPTGMIVVTIYSQSMPRVEAAQLLLEIIKEDGNVD